MNREEKKVATKRTDVLLLVLLGFTQTESVILANEFRKIINFTCLP
jgi:hypothetical protein